MASIRIIVKNLTGKLRTAGLCFFFLTGIILFAGCSNKFWDPMQVGRFRPTPAVNVILDSLGVAEEEPSQWEGAEEPRPSDLMVLERDYTFSPGDFVKISIFLTGESKVSCSEVKI